MPRILQLFKRLYGPYPFRQVGAVIDRAPDVGYSLETQTRPVFDTAPDDVLLAHELSHQWFGDSVSLGRWPDMWLNEGFATWSEWRWAQANGGISTARQFAKYARMPDRKADLWAPPPAAIGEPKKLFADSVYVRGAMALEALRQRIGNDAFYATLRAWVAAHRYSNARIDQFVALAEAQSGPRRFDRGPGADLGGRARAAGSGLRARGRLAPAQARGQPARRGCVRGYGARLYRARGAQHADRTGRGDPRAAEDRGRRWRSRPRGSEALLQPRALVARVQRPRPPARRGRLRSPTRAGQVLRDLGVEPGRVLHGPGGEPPRPGRGGDDGPRRRRDGTDGPDPGDSRASQRPARQDRALLRARAAAVALRARDQDHRYRRRQSG